MALILCIETATKSCSVALVKEGVVLARREEVSDRYSHAEQLTLFIEAVLQEQEKSMKDLAAVAVSKGPGSYTGLRIGVSTAKGLCYALDIPLMAISTLEAMAKGMQSKEVADLYCPMIDARRMEVYCALYAAEGQQSEIAAKVIDEDSFKDVLEKKSILFFGDGADKCQETIQHQNARFIEQLYPSATDMAVLASQAYAQQNFEDVAYFEPYYLKDFVAGKPKKLV